MIATLAEIKVLLQISDTTKDALITALLPICEADLLAYCNSHFGTIPENSAGLEAVSMLVSFDDTTKKITSLSAELPVFSVGSIIYIAYSKRNDGFYTVAASDTGSITVSEELLDDTLGRAVTIYKVKFPAALKAVLADMINFKIQKKDVGITSESISGGASVSYESGGGGYPASIYSALSKYRVIKVL